MKSEEMNAALEQIFGVNINQSISDSVCTICGKSAVEFRNDISKKEYQISGMCQACQNETFGVD